MPRLRCPEPSPLSPTLLPPSLMRRSAPNWPAPSSFFSPYAHNDYGWLNSNLWDRERTAPVHKEALEIMRRNLEENRVALIEVICQRA